MQPTLSFPKIVAMNLFWEDFDKLKEMLKPAIVAKGSQHLLISHAKLKELIDADRLDHPVYQLDMNVELELRRMALHHSHDYIILHVK